MTAKRGPSNPIPARATYEPVEQPVVVIGSQFLARYPVDLTVTSSGGKDFKIIDVNGTLIFQVKSKSFSFHGRRFLRDAAGNTLVSYREKRMSLHNRREVFRGECQDEENLLFRGATTSRMYQFKNIDLNIYLANNSVAEAPDFKVHGSGKERSCAIYLRNGESYTIIGKMQRNFAGNFTVTAYPNVDYAFIVAPVVFVFLDVINADRMSQPAGFSADVAVGIIEASAAILGASAS